MQRSRYSDFLAFAIKNEREAAELYQKYAATVAAPAQKSLLESMSAMEKEHEEKLTILSSGGETTLGNNDRVVDLHLSDYLVETTLTPQSDLQDVIIFAIHAEKKAFDLYTALARLEEDPAAKDLLERLASEEQKHKYDLESTFEKQFISEN